MVPLWLRRMYLAAHATLTEMSRELNETGNSKTEHSMNRVNVVCLVSGGDRPVMCSH